MRYIEFFPYLPQNPRTDAPIQDRSSMPVEIASGAGMEAIIFGTFGIKIDNDKMTISPNTHEGLGISTLKDFRFKGNSYNIRIDKRDFSVWLNNEKVTEKPFGESVVFK